MADYSHLSTNEMLAAKRYGTPLGPIFSHALNHATFMFLVLLPFLYGSWIVLASLYMLQLWTHFIIDVGKGRLTKIFTQTGDNTKRPYWYVFGFDQFLHQLVIIIMAYIATLYHG